MTHPIACALILLFAVALVASVRAFELLSGVAAIYIDPNYVPPSLIALWLSVWPAAV
jgi:hypothetical protein